MNRRVIFKYQLDHGVTSFRLPIGSAVLHVGCQSEDLPTLWIEQADTDGVEREQRDFTFVGTGQPFPTDVRTYLGSVQTPHGLVWHIYELHGGKQ